MSNEFDIRGKQYSKTISKYPEARKSELLFVQKLLKPKSGEKILDLGCGNGYISSFLSDLVGKNGKVFASDISLLLLKEVQSLNKKNIVTVKNSEKRIALPDKYVDTVFSFTGFHHFSDQVALMKECFRVLKPGGRIFIFDIFNGTPVAQYADDIWGKYMSTGHEVKWLSKEYIDTLCFLADFRKPKIYKGGSYREFDTLKNVGIFFKNLHSLGCSERIIMQALKKYIGIYKKGAKYIVPWRIDVAVTSKK